jgi:hypothetical protein
MLETRSFLLERCSAASSSIKCLPFSRQFPLHSSEYHHCGKLLLSHSLHRIVGSNCLATTYLPEEKRTPIGNM